MGERHAQPVLALLGADQFDLRSGQVDRGGHDPQVGDRGFDGGILDPDFGEQHIIGADRTG